jgi:hypothetical protein
MTANEIALSIFGAMQLVSSGFIFILWRRERLKTEKWYRKWGPEYQKQSHGFLWRKFDEKHFRCSIAGNAANGVRKSYAQNAF